MADTPSNDFPALAQRWFPVQKADRVADIHLRLLAEAATEALKSLDYLAVATNRQAALPRAA